MNCNGLQTTVHSPTDIAQNGSCNKNGCFKGTKNSTISCQYLNQNEGWIKVKAEFGKDGNMDVYYNDELVFDGSKILTENAKSDIVKTMNSQGVVIIGSLWGSSGTDMSWLAGCSDSNCTSGPL